MGKYTRYNSVACLENYMELRVSEISQNTELKLGADHGLPSVLKRCTLSSKLSGATGEL